MSGFRSRRRTAWCLLAMGMGIRRQWERPGKKWLGHAMRSGDVVSSGGDDVGDASVSDQTGSLRSRVEMKRDTARETRRRKKGAKRRKNAPDDS